MLKMPEQKTIAVFKRAFKILAPPPSLTVSEWADTYRKLSEEASAEPGQWNTDRAPYQREIMDAVTDPDIEDVVVMTSAQVGKTEIELNVVGYYIHQDPSPIMVVVPNKDPVAKDWSRDRLAPMIRDTDVLYEKVSDPKARDGANSTLHKQFPGGLLVIAGANAPADLASRPIRILLFDEVDRFPESAGSEGDPISIAEKRTETFWNRKKIKVSTPTLKGQSRIEDEYERGTMEEWRVECPNCGEYVYLNFYGTKFQHRWVSDSNAEVWDVTFQCPVCFEKYDERTWKSQPGQYIAQHPEVKGIRSFHLNAFSSPWSSWNKIIKQWLEAKRDPEKLKVVKNTLFGESWEEKGDIENEDFLMDRREDYGAELPFGVLLLTAAVDVQDDRFEYEIVGWGKGEQSWAIEYGIILGKPDQQSTWNILDDKLQQVWHFSDGRGLMVACTGVDSGGHFTEEVYKYCKKNEHRRVFALKGMGGPGIPFIHKVSRTEKERAILVVLGVDSGKSTIMGRLKIREPGDGYFHFPAAEDRGYDRDYFKGLISEKKAIRYYKGVKRVYWETVSEHVRNEPLDLRNYAMAAMKVMNPNFDMLEERLNQVTPGVKAQAKQPQKRTGCVRRGID
jgi:phage terminase large subunit GpA-like protein